MHQKCTYGSVGASGGQPPEATWPVPFPEGGLSPFLGGRICAGGENFSEVVGSLWKKLEFRSSECGLRQRRWPYRLI